MRIMKNILFSALFRQHLWQIGKHISSSQEIPYVPEDWGTASAIVPLSPLPPPFSDSHILPVMRIMKNILFSALFRQHLWQIGKHIMGKELFSSTVFPLKQGERAWREFQLFSIKIRETGALQYKLPPSCWNRFTIRFTIASEPPVGISPLPDTILA